MGVRRLVAAEHAMSPADRDPPELLVVLVDERARVVVDVADRDTTEAIGIAQARVARSGEDRIHGRGGQPERRSDAVRTPASLDPQAQDRRDRPRRRDPGLAMRSARAILEARPALDPIAGHPLVGGLPTDPLGLGGLGHRPAVDLHPRDEQLAAEHVETSRTMPHESLLRVGVLNTPNHGARLSLVNNLPGNHS